MVKANHDLLVEAFEFAIDKAREDGVNVVDNVVDWRRRRRLTQEGTTDLHGVVTFWDSSGGVSPTRARYLGGGVGGRRPAKHNTITVPPGGWPGGGNSPTVIVLSADIPAGKKPRLPIDGVSAAVLEEVSATDGSWISNLSIGGTSSHRRDAFVIFYGHLLWRLGIAADVIREGRRIPLAAYVDTPQMSKVYLAEVRSLMRDFIASRYCHECDGPMSTGFNADFVSSLPLLAVSGVWGENTTRALQEVLRDKYGLWGTYGAISLTGEMDVNTVSALQKMLNQKDCALIAEDGIFGDLTKKALQSYLGTSPDGIIGSVTTKVLQSFLNKGAL